MRLISIADIVPSDPEITTVLIEGDPGMGKTTACQKIVVDWSSEVEDYFISDYTLVFVMEGRAIALKGLDQCLQSLLPKKTEVDSVLDWIETVCD